MHLILESSTRHRALIALTAFTAACGKVDSGLDNLSDSLAIAARIVVDTVHVDGRNPEPLTLVRDLVIGNAADTTAVDWIAGARLLAADSGGRVAVNARRRLKVFNPSGSIEWFTIPDRYRPGQMRNAMRLTFKPKDSSVPRPNRWFSYAFGRATGAPGQLSDAHSIIFAGDTIAVMDLASGLQLFNRQGRSLAISPIVPPPDSNRLGFRRLTTLGPTAAGWIAVFGNRTPYRGEDFASGRQQLLLYRISARTGAVGSRLAFSWHDSAAHVTAPYRPPRGGRGREESLTARAGSARRTRVMRDPFAPVSRHAVAGGSLYFSEGRDFVVDVYDGYGRHTRRISVDTERRQMTAPQREERIRSAVRTTVPDSTAPGAMAAIDSALSALSALPAPRYHNVVGEMFVAGNGAIAVQRRDLDSLPPSQPRGMILDVLNPDGTVRGRARIPPELRVMQFTGDAFYCLEKIGEAGPTAPAAGPARPGQNTQAVPVQQIVRLILREGGGS